jgi:homopolymeric O-antigen transport system permease protein
VGATFPGMSVPLIEIEPARGWQALNLREVWAFRYLLPALVRRNVTRRYRQTLLGPAWFVMSPLVRMVGFSVVLGHVIGLPSDGAPYPIFAYTALLPWEYFAAGVSRTTSSLVSHLHIISKVYFPRLLLPLSEVVSALVDLGLSFAILLPMLAYYGYGLTPRILVLPVLVVWAAGLSLGVGLLFAALQVRYRDVSSLVGWLVRAWFFATPVVYSSSIVAEKVPAWAAAVYRLNPMTAVVEGFRWALLGTGPGPDWTLAWGALVMLALLWVGAMLFQRAEHSIVDLV